MSSIKSLEKLISSEQDSIFIVEKDPVVIIGIVQPVLQTIISI